MFFREEMMIALLPTLSNGAMLVLTSSQTTQPDSPIIKMLNATYPDGKPVIKLENWYVPSLSCIHPGWHVHGFIVHRQRACLSCTRRNIADRCTHIVQRPQHWQKRGDQTRVHALMGTFEGSFEREMLYVNCFISYFM